MPLSWNEIRSRATAFTAEWQHAASEDADAKSFWDAFFEVFGVSRRRVATFEQIATKHDGGDGFIDLFWRGVLLVEHKSKGKNLDKAYAQAKGYFKGIKDYDLPRYVVVCDFARFRLYDLEAGTPPLEFTLAELPQNIQAFGFIAGYQTRILSPQDPVNIAAAERLGKLHDALKDSGYAGHELEVLLVRLLFCLFAEDNAVFERRQFQDYIEQRSAEDGSDLGARLASLFQVLNQAEDKRQKTLDEQLNAFRYINGRLFEEQLSIASFDSAMRESLLECCALDWSRISPAIFGSLFQSIMDPKARRALGAHYTSETNILKALNPLFLDDLHAELEDARRVSGKLDALHRKLANIRVLDPACGCGNFLVVAYRELRLLELELLRAKHKKTDTRMLDVGAELRVDVDQMYGIEIEEFPAQIAQVALWLTDHQLNVQFSNEFGQYFARLPLKKSATIVNANALRLDWRTVIDPAKLSYIVGNPPFLGKQHQNEAQKRELETIFHGLKGVGILDYVTGWYVLAANFMQGTNIRVAFVSTNSITQGEQVGVLWPVLLQAGVKLFFAHRTFSWHNEAAGMAAVHCVIIGFAIQDVSPKRIFEYSDIKSDPTELRAKQINSYLVDAPNLAVLSRREPIAEIPSIVFGNMPNDGGFLLINDASELNEAQRDAIAGKYVRQFLGADEFLNGLQRWCFWLVDAPLVELRQSRYMLERLDKVRNHRLASSRAATVELAATPHLFGEIRQSTGNYLIVPRHSSENRIFIPIGYSTPDVICGDSNLMVPNATLYHFGILTSTMHMAWMRTVAGRLESRYRYSASIVYNNFPWPDVSSQPPRASHASPTPHGPSNPLRTSYASPSARGTIGGGWATGGSGTTTGGGAEVVAKIEAAAQAVLDARAAHPGSTLADLYDPTLMSADLRKAHEVLDKAVDAAYGKTKFENEAQRVAFLFERYQQITAPLAPTPSSPPQRGGRVRSTQGVKSDAVSKKGRRKANS